MGSVASRVRFVLDVSFRAAVSNRLGRAGVPQIERVGSKIDDATAPAPRARDAAHDDPGRLVIPRFPLSFHSNAAILERFMLRLRTSSPTKINLCLASIRLWEGEAPSEPALF